MNFLALQQEVLAHGFDPIQYGARIKQYLNDGQNEIARRINYYVDEASQTIATVNGTTSYTFPADFARARSLRDTDRQVELQYVGLRDIDRSSTSVGIPNFYALDGANLHLYPTPDGVHNLSLRYWKLPAQMVADTDVPSLPNDYHNVLWEYAVGICYRADDDAQMYQVWNQIWEKSVARFAVDVKFPDTDGPSVVRGMWDQEPSLSASSWTLYGGG